MSESTYQSHNLAKSADLAKEQLDKSYFKKGVSIGLFSGISYGLYTALVTLATAYGIWSVWYKEGSTLSAFAVTFIIGTMATGINDLFSALWAISNAIFKGKFSDFIKTINTKPGIMLIIAALIGGPIAGVCYILGVQIGGPVVIPIAGLNVVFGAILASVVFKQKLGFREKIGVVICVCASLLIGLTSLRGKVSDGIILGIILALLAAFGWGLEGTIAGFGTSMIDSEIGITIRQTISSLINLIVLLPIMGLIEGSGFGLISSLMSGAFADKTIFVFIISGLLTFASFNSWYKGNSMCGAALGMALNGTYTFFGPFFCWIILGVILNNPGYELSVMSWIGSLLMAIGIFIMSVNLKDLLKKGDK